METKYIKNLMISGLSITTNNNDEISEDKAKITQLWEDYASDNTYTKTFNKANNTSMYGVYSDYENDQNGNYRVTVGVEVIKPKGAIIIENQKYLVFSKNGELPQIIIDTWQEIWEYFENNDEYQREFNVDFEKYSKENEIEIYIAIK